ncbi:MAG: plastocyanin/azurin family copper-binding protein [Gemmatimonadota bacterium]|nr:plastocyanin/azurin family copper-binding protein [Gemmatimonadota bacterium]
MTSPGKLLDRLGGLSNMRFLGLAIVTTAALMVSACSKGTDRSGDSAKAANAEAAAPAAGAPGAAAVAMKPITGTTHEVKMIGDEKGYRFEPAVLNIKEGDGVKFIMISGGPHNVAFDAPSLTPPVKAQLGANMGPDQIAELSSKYVQAANEEYTISFAGIPAGTYDYVCTPHLAFNMRGKLTVQ